MNGGAPAAALIQSLPPVTLSTGQSVRPDGAQFPWMVEGGNCEVYALVGTRRVFLGVAERGTLVVPPDPAVASLSLLALQDCRLVALSPETWTLIGLESLPLAIDRWCSLLSAGLGELVKPRPAVQPLGADESLVLSGAAAVTATSGVVWIVAGGEEPARLMGERPLPAEAPVPVGYHSWITVDAGVRLRTLGTPGLLAIDRDGSGVLDALRAHATHVAALAGDCVRAAEAREMERTVRRDTQVDHQLRQSFGRFHRIFADNAMAPPQENDCGFVYRTVTGTAPAPQAVAAQTDDFELFAALNNARLRSIPLTDRWWRRDVGPLVVRRRRDGKLAAVRSDWLGRYRFHALEERPRLVTARLAAELEPTARILTRPLPNQAVTVRQILWMGITLCSLDIATLAIAVVAASLLGLLLPIATGRLIDLYIPSALQDPTLMIGLGLVVALAGVSAINLTSAILRLRMDGRIAELIGGGVMDRVLRLPGSATRSMASAELAMRVGAVDGIRRAVMGVVLNALMAGVGGISGIALLTYYSPLGGAVAAGLVAALVGIGVLAGIRQMDAILKGDQMTMNVSALALQIIDNMPVLRAFAAERRAFARWAANSAEMRARAMRSKGIANVFEAILAAGQILAIALVFAILGYSAGPAAGLSTGGYMVFVTTFQTFLAAGVLISRGASQLISLKPQITLAQPLLQNVPESAQHRKDPGEISGALEASNVDFEGEGGKQLLKSISFRAPAGSFLALVGPSGSGKSTLVSLLIGFERPSTGSIRYDGRDLTSLDPIKLRRQIGYVRQDGRLFAGSLRENIQGPHDAALGDVWRAAEMAGIADDIRAMPMGLHTMVTEGASAFSGGQIQRLLLARALIGAPKVLLLDEATSALDSLSQARVTRSIDALGATRIVVAHRLSTVRNADLILFMDQGRIVESGKFEDLIQRGGAFARFAQRQVVQ